MAENYRWVVGGGWGAWPACTALQPCRLLTACACARARARACARCRSMDAFLRLRDSISSGQLGAIACLDMAVDLGRQAGWQSW